MIRKINQPLVYLLIVFLSAGCQALTGKTAGQNIDDATITAEVKAKLVQEKAANLTRIDVDTENATVYLTGVVQSPADKSRAETLTREVAGVRRVVNNIQLQSSK